MGGSNPPPWTCNLGHGGVQPPPLDVQLRSWGGPIPPPRRANVFIWVGGVPSNVRLLQRIITLPAQHRRAVALANPYELIIFFFVMHIPPALKP